MSTAAARRRPRFPKVHPGFVSTADVIAATRTPQLGDGVEAVDDAARLISQARHILKSGNPGLLEVAERHLAEAHAGLRKLAEQLTRARAYDHAHAEEWPARPARRQARTKVPALA